MEDHIKSPTEPPTSTHWGQRKSRRLLKVSVTICCFVVREVVVLYIVLFFFVNSSVALYKYICPVLTILRSFGFWLTSWVHLIRFLQTHIHTHLKIRTSWKRGVSHYWASLGSHVWLCFVSSSSSLPTTSGWCGNVGSRDLVQLQILFVVNLCACALTDLHRGNETFGRDRSRNSLLRLTGELLILYLCVCVLWYTVAGAAFLRWLCAFFPFFVFDRRSNLGGAPGFSNCLRLQ